MPNFAYKVRSAGGGVLTGVLEAPDKTAATSRLRSQKYIVLEINESKPGLLDALKNLNPLKPSVKPKDLVLFSRQLATLVSAGVPIVQGLSILEDQIENPAFKSVVRGVREDIEAGVQIAEAMKRHPEAFSELYVSMVRSGEAGGVLDTILERISNYLEAAEKLRGKVRGAMVYPAVVSLIAAGVTVFLLTFVIPTFEKIFGSFGADLPIPTQILINISHALQRFFWVVLAAPVLAFLAFRQFYKTEKGRMKVDELSLKLPMFGTLLRKVAIARFTRTLGTLVKSGVPILSALETVAKTAGNKVVEKAVLEARESIREGERIAEPLRRCGVFPPMVIQMISVGEETGNLDTMLSKVADFYDEEVNVAVAALTSMIEPIIIVVMGVVIGSIVIAMFLPMFELGGLVGKAA